MLVRHLVRQTLNNAVVNPSYSRSFRQAAVLNKKDQLPSRPTLPDHELRHVYLKGSGPGGQKINKTNSAVQLTHIPTGIVVKSQATRSRSQNHNIARRILAEKIELLEKGEDSRAAKKIERARKKKASSMKKSRRKYKKLEEEKQTATDVDADQIGDVDEEREDDSIKHQNGGHDIAKGMDRSSPQ